MRMKGFTLLEILVVMVIMGIILSFATLLIDHSGEVRLMQREARRLASVLMLASQEAVLQAKEIAVLLTPQRYQFYVLENEQWQPIDKDNLLRSYTLPANLQLELRLEGEIMALKSAKMDQPQLLLLSSGELPLFEIILKSELHRQIHYRLTSQFTGQIQVDRHETL